MKEVPVKVTVNKIYKQNKIVQSTETEQETVDVVRLDPDAAYVTISTDRKLNLGMPNYSSVGCSVFVSVPSPLDDEQMEQAYQFAANFCENKLAEIVADKNALAKRLAKLVESME